jgi:hypothetical protein
MFYTAHYNLKDEDNEIEEEEIDAALKKVLINISFNREIDLGKIMRGQDCILNFSVDRNEVS